MSAAADREHRLAFAQPLVVDVQLAAPVAFALGVVQLAERDLQPEQRTEQPEQFKQLKQRAELSVEFSLGVELRVNERAEQPLEHPVELSVQLGFGVAESGPGHRVA